MERSIVSFDPALKSDGEYSFLVERDGQQGECTATIEAGQVKPASTGHCRGAGVQLNAGQSPRSESESSVQQGHATALLSLAWSGLSETAKVKVVRNQETLWDQSVRLTIAADACPSGSNSNVQATVTVEKP